MLAPRELFKVGFLLRCADENLSPAETQSRIERASEFVGSVEKQGFLGGAGEFLSALVKAIPQLSLLGLGASGVAGLTGGYTAGKLTDEALDPDEIKRQELIAAYQQQSDRARRAMSRRQYRRAAPRRPQLIT